MCVGQVKAFLVGSNVVRDVSLFSKILAALVTGELALVSCESNWIYYEHLMYELH